MFNAFEISPQEVKTRREKGEALTLIDVREDWELEAARIEGALHIPMDDLPDSLDRIPREGPVVIMCHQGGRSVQVVMWLRMQGYTNVQNLSGGIDAWSWEADPSVPRY